MKKLQEQFERTIDGTKLLFTQISREVVDDDVLYVYHVKQEDGHFWAYEVFLAKIQKKDIKMPTKDKNGNHYISPAGEKYPSNSDFGSIAYHLGGKHDVAKWRIDQYRQILIDKVTSKKSNKNKSKDAKDNYKAAS